MESLEYYKDLFYSYAKPFLEDSELKSALSIKIEHTFEVLQMAFCIAQELPERLHLPLQLACLFHDLGRFEQIKRYKTFLDAKSCNHAFLSVKMLKKHNFLSALPKDQQKLIYTAILMHNKIALPENLEEDLRLLCLALRDADKVDILRVMVENFENPSVDADTVFLHVKEEDKYTKSIYEDLMAGRTIKYTDLVYVNDFRLLIGGWLNEIHFCSALNVIKQRKAFEIILKKLPQDENMQKAKAYIFSLLEKNKNTQGMFLN